PISARYDEVEIDVTGAESVEAVESAILSELAARARSIRAESGNVACWCCRLLVTGRTPLAGRPELANLAQPLQESPQHIESLLVAIDRRSEEHTSELQSRENLVCRLLLEKKKK